MLYILLPRFCKNMMYAKITRLLRVFPLACFIPLPPNFLTKYFTTPCLGHHEWHICTPISSTSMAPIDKAFTILFFIAVPELHRNAAKRIHKFNQIPSHSVLLDGVYIFFQRILSPPLSNYVCFAPVFYRCRHLSEASYEHNCKSGWLKLCR